jgi:hypothetical protein
MRTLLVYESMFGNTRAVAEAIAAGFGPGLSIVEVSGAPAAVGSDVDLVIVGGPTHAFSMTRPTTRADAERQAKDGVVSRRGIREWLDEVELPTPRPSVATFDTRIRKPSWLTGSAAKAAAKRLRARGCRPPVGLESFFVVGTPGPLADGEVDRARDWGRALRDRVGTLT